MQIINHRCNTIAQLQQTPNNLGVEIDIRSFGQKLVLHHEPFTDAVLFADWLMHFKHKTLILNVKEEGLESSILALMCQHNINDFFFLDQSFPFLIKTANAQESRCAVRLSEYESIQTVISLANKVDWVWLDCFTKLPLDYAEAQLLKTHNFKLCLVSPELQGRDRDAIIQMQTLLTLKNITIDAVCTKYPELWR